MPRPAQLIYTGKLAHQDSTQQRIIIANCEDGVPLGWILCFGGRNYWEPGDHVDDRGGAMGERDRFETPLEVAEARLRQALDAVSDYEPIWVWFAGLELLHRRLLARGQRGFLHIEAAWMISDPHFRSTAIQAIPYAENLVNLVSTNRGGEIVRAVAPLEQVCPFVPHGRFEDRARFAALRGKSPLPPAVEAVTLLAGTPPGDVQKFHKHALDHYGETFSRIETLRYPAFPEAKRLSGTQARPATGPKRGGFLGRLKGMLGKGN
jgi:hypothetical protein